MKIINIVRRFAFEEWGGTETVVWNTAKKLESRGNEIEILCTDALSGTADETRENIAIRRFPCFYPRFPMTEKRRIALDKKGGNPFSPKLLKYLKHSAASADMLHCHTTGRIAGYARSVSREYGIPYVISLHGGRWDIPKEEIEEIIKPVRGTFHYGRLMDIFTSSDRYLEDASGIICVGKNEYELAKEKFPRKSIEYIPNGIDCEVFAQAAATGDFRKKHGIEADCTVILCVSRIDYQKNQAELVKLAAQLRNRGENIRLALIGPVTSESYLSKIKQTASELDFQKELIIIEGIKPYSPELIDAYKSSDVFILPSLHEPFGIVVLEAWAAGIPVIAADTGGLSYLIKNGENGLLCPKGSLKDFENSYFRLKQDAALKNKIVERAAWEAGEEYSWENICDRLEDFYSKVKGNFKP